MQQDILQFVHEFIQALQARESADELSRFYHQDAEQIEFPNTLSRHITIRNLADLKTASEKGKKVLQEETYEIVRSYCFENTVVIEAIWKGILAVPLGNIPAGGQLKAYFAQFYEFRDGKIFRQRNYDCFEAFT